MGMESRDGETENEVQSVSFKFILDGAYEMEKVGFHQESRCGIRSAELSEHWI